MYKWGLKVLLGKTENVEMCPNDTADEAHVAFVFG